MDPAFTPEQLQRLRKYFDSHVTYSYSFRREQLIKLRQAILDNQQELYTALFTDLKKSKEECWVTELGLVIADINVTLRNLKDWMRPERVGTNLLNLPSSSKVLKEPLGVVCILAPWNYPFYLLINPLVGAIAAGNCVVLKPSENAPATEVVIRKIIESVFPPEYILYVTGNGAEVVPAMLSQFRFDHIFYTGNTAVGRVIYKLAAETLTPVTLELGGKSPAVVESDANIKVTARRIAVTKFSNCGQMCVAPDYVLVHESKKEELVMALKKSIQDFFQGKPEESENYGKIINERQFDRLQSYLSNATVAFGGQTNRKELFIGPTLITDVKLDGPLMKEEIFGPILPIVSFTTSEEAKSFIAKNPNPLAFYIFTSSGKKEKEWIEGTAFGGGCVNNTSWHLTNHHLPFGGRGFSGTGNYHGKYSFDTFTHKKAVMKTPTWFDPAIKYPPFKGKLRLFKWVIK